MGQDDTTIGQSTMGSSSQLALVLWHGDEPHVHPLPGERPLVLGRAAPADIVIEVPTLSREHVRIGVTGGRVVVTDLGSKNGVRVDGQRVERAELGPGDAFEAGGVQAFVTAVLPHARPGSRYVHRRALLEAIDAELARHRITGRTFTVAIVETGPHVDPSARVRTIDRCALFSPGRTCILLPELSAADARALLESRLSGARGGLAACGHRDGAAALVEAARGALEATRGSSRFVMADEPERESAVVMASPGSREVFALAERFATSDRPVLVLGETGVGKELVAQHLHAASARRVGPLRALNCAAIPASLVESTLFGHERGAFTGATERKRGAFEEASGGTLFLDEIGELALPAQAALLRVLETGRLSRVGSSDEIAVDVRVVAATHRDLDEAVHEGRFRADLLHRLRVLVLEVPPLRERPEDVVALAHAFLRRACAAAGHEPLTFDASAVTSLLAYDWPGNVRELRNVVERAVLLASGPTLTVGDLADRVRAQPRTPEPHVDEGSGWDLRERLREFEAELIVSALEACAGNQVAAAKLLGVPRRTLVHKISKLGLRRRWERG